MILKGLDDFFPPYSGHLPSIIRERLESDFLVIRTRIDDYVLAKRMDPA